MTRDTRSIDDPISAESVTRQRAWAGAALDAYLAHTGQLDSRSAHIADLIADLLHLLEHELIEEDEDETAEEVLARATAYWRTEQAPPAADTLVENDMLQHLAWATGLRPDTPVNR